MFSRFLLMAVLLPVLAMVATIWYPQQACAQPPAGVLALGEEEHAFADYPGMFDNLGDARITIEAWFYLTHMPPKWRENWVMVSKPGSYTIVIRGKDPFLPESVDPEGTTYVEYMEISGHEDGGVGGGSLTTRLLPDRSPLFRWIHIAYQYQLEGGERVQSANFFDGRNNGESHNRGFPIDHSHTALFIGGGTGRGSLKGWIDEVRISNTWRYPATFGIKINPQKRFQTDGHTIALWHFDEGPWADHYADASGNGYTLLVERAYPRDVDHARRLATVWGSLKEVNAIVF